MSNMESCSLARSDAIALLRVVATLEALIQSGALSDVNVDALRRSLQRHDELAAVDDGEDRDVQQTLGRLAQQLHLALGDSDDPTARPVG